MHNYRVKFQKNLELKMGQGQYLKRGSHFYEVIIYSNGSVTITDMSNAGKRGTQCPQFFIESSNDAPRLAFWNELLRDHIEELLMATTKEVLPAHLFRSYLRFGLDRIKSVRLMPLDLATIKPLKIKPKKWTIPHIIRALINGQYENLRSCYTFTDDYAFDNSVNFQEGPIVDGIQFAAKIIKNPSGWWVMEGHESKLGINCHGFNSNEFTPKIEKASKAGKGCGFSDVQAMTA